MIAILLMVVGVMLLVALVLTASKSTVPGKRSGGRRIGTVDREFVARKWQAIEGMASGGGSLRDAVSEADKLLDYSLKQLGVRGETMGERLKSSGSRFSDLDAIWSAHKLRNALAHEADFDLVPSQAKAAIKTFRQGLTDLGVL